MMMMLGCVVVMVMILRFVVMRRVDGSVGGDAPASIGARWK